VRRGSLRIQVWNGRPGADGGSVAVRINGEDRTLPSGTIVSLASGERITLRPGVYHEFWPDSETCVLGEVSTANDDVADNYFADPTVGRFPPVDEDEAPLVRLLGD